MSGWTQLGYLVLEKDDPVKLDPNKGTAFFRETVMKAGCCGLREMLKMHAFKLKQYKKVLAPAARSSSLHCPSLPFLLPRT